jgi:hypothetical protein
MTDAAHIERLQDEALAQLLELGMEAAREAHARLMASEDSKALADCALAFNRTAALQAKVARARKHRDRDDATDAQRADAVRISRRKDQVKATVERLIWTEAEGGEAERLESHLEDLVAEDALYDGFLAQPVEIYIARLRQDLGLSAEPEQPARQSSG